MEKDKVTGHGGGGGGGLPPSSSRYASFGSSSSGYTVKPEPSSSSSSQVPPLNPESTSFANPLPESNRFSQDISQMPDFPPRNRGHRRAHSEILSLPDDISFDSDLGVVGSGDGPSFSDETEEDFFSMYLDMDKLGAASGSELGGSEILGTSVMGSEHLGAATLADSSSQNENLGLGSNDKPRVRHQHSQSMDGSTSMKSELLGSNSEGPSFAEAKKAMSAAKLADLAVVDPKRAKRIWANRQSAARSKERKMRYIAELERKVQTLQTEATTLAAQLTMLQRDTNGLTAENNELKLRLQTMEQQVHLQDALNDALREEVQRLKVATGQMMPNGPMMNFGPSTFGVNQQLYHHNQAMQSLLAAQQLQQLQIHPQHQQQLHPHQHQHQQQLHPHQHQHQQQQPPADLRMRGSMAPQNQREVTTDNNTAPME